MNSTGNKQKRQVSGEVVEGIILGQMGHSSQIADERYLGLVKNEKVSEAEIFLGSKDKKDIILDALLIIFRTGHLKMLFLSLQLFPNIFGDVLSDILRDQFTSVCVYVYRSKFLGLSA